MKNTTILLLAVLTVLLAACQIGGPTSPPGPELQKASVEWDRLFDQGDAAQLAALYADDAVSMPPHAPTVTGRRAIQEEFRSFMAANVARHETRVDEIIQEGDLAIERAHYRLIYRPRAGGAEVTEAGRHIECRRKIAGEWQIVWEIWNTEETLPK